MAKDQELRPEDRLMMTSQSGVPVTMRADRLEDWERGQQALKRGDPKALKNVEWLEEQLWRHARKLGKGR